MAHFASLRFAPPEAVAVDGIWLGRRVDRAGVLGTHVDDRRSSRSTSRATLDGVFGLDGRRPVGRARASAATPTRRRTATPPGAGVDFRFAALMVRDESKPHVHRRWRPGLRVRARSDARASTPATRGSGWRACERDPRGRSRRRDQARPELLRRALPGRQRRSTSPLAEDCPAVEPRDAGRWTPPPSPTGSQPPPGRRRRRAPGNTSVRDFDVKVAQPPAGRRPPRRRPRRRASRSPSRRRRRRPRRRQERRRPEASPSTTRSRAPAR